MESDPSGSPERAIVPPDYRGGGLVNLMASIILALGGQAGPYPPAALLTDTPLGEARSLVLLVLDALGYRLLMEHAAPEGTLRRHLVGSLTSVFPSTTATAVTTFLTGTAPQQHGVTGWFMFLREVGSVVSVLPFRARHGGPCLADLGIQPGALFGAPSMAERVAVATFVVQPEWIARSAFNRAHSGPAEIHGYSSLRQGFQTVTEIVSRPGARRYVYAYWPGLDTLCHDHGPQSHAVKRHLDEIDLAFERLLAATRGTNTLFLVTADHGCMATAPKRVMEVSRLPELNSRLVIPLCGESRLAYCYAGPGAEADFEAEVGAELHGWATVFESAALLSQNYFGLGAPHPDLKDRIGHYALAMADGFTLKDWILGEERFTHLGAHGGLSADEMLVPLIVARA